jgi:hypothetical protein
MCLVMVLLSASMQAQVLEDARAREEVRRSHTVKLNLAAAAFRKVSVYYEYGFSEHWSAQLGAGYKFMGKIPDWIGLGDFVITSNSRGIKGLSLSPEVRYHFWNNHCEERSGLYLGAYGRFTNLYGDISFKYWNGTQYIDVGGAGDMREFGFGLQLGYELTIRERWVIDLMFMGPRLSTQKLKLEMDSRFAHEVIPKIEEEINKRLEYLGMDPISIPADPSAEIRFGFRNFRYAIGVGYRF